jgi:hypothetical protein
MARRTAALKPQLNQIRTWARDGRTDAWIAFQLGTTALTVQEFRTEHGLGRGGGNTAEEPVTPEMVVQTIPFDTPPPAPAPRAASDEAVEEAVPARTRRQRRSRPAAGADASVETGSAVQADIETTSTTIIEGEPAERAKRRRRRGGRGGAGAAADVAAPADEQAVEPASAEPSRAAARRRTRTPASYSGSLVSGAVIVLDPAVTRSAAWRAHWADAPSFDVLIEDEQIVLRRRTEG